MSFDTLFILIILLLLAVAFPLLGVRDFRLLLRRTNEGVADARMKFYKGVLVFHWPLTIGLLAWWLLSGNSLESMGLIPVADGGIESQRRGSSKRPYPIWPMGPH